MQNRSKWLKNEKWYGTTGDMEHLFHSGRLNFGHKPNFRPNYIVPNLNSIIRCLKGGTGLAVVPDFLCKNEIESGETKADLGRKEKVENTLYFGCRKNQLSNGNRSH
jgi:DNA-binding transcriptional LysR family regulator